MAYVSESDEKLARRCAEGDQAAFDALVERHLDGLFRFAELACGPSGHAEDALSLALSTAWQRAASIPPDTSPRCWLFKVLVEACHLLAPCSESREEEPGVRGDPATTARPADAGTAATLTCGEVQARLSEYLDGELPPEAVSEMDRHLCACAECASCREQTRAIIEALQAHASACERLGARVRVCLRQPFET